MPKVIDHAKEQILEAAKRLILERTYAGVSMRTIAAECGVSVGTIYNYFKDKETLIASFMLEDWLKMIRKMEPVCKDAATPSEAFACIYRGLQEYQRFYSAIFTDRAAEAAYGVAARDYHEALCAQLSALLQPTAERAKGRNSGFLAEFAAEALLTWTLRGRSLEEIDDMLQRLF